MLSRIIIAVDGKGGGAAVPALETHVHALRQEFGMCSHLFFQVTSAI